MDEWFCEIVQTYSPQLYKFAYERVQVQQDAEDIVQETFMRAYSALKSYSPERIQELHLSSWLYKITQNIILNHRRSLRAKKCYPATSLDRIDSNTITQMDQSGAIEEADVIRNALEHLSPQYRNCLMLGAYGLSLQEIAGKLKITTGCVAAYISRGRSQFRHEYYRLQNKAGSVGYT